MLFIVLPRSRSGYAADATWTTPAHRAFALASAARYRLDVMKVIGLAGRAGSGKSAIAHVLAQRPGVEWVDLDAVAWETYAKGKPAFKRLTDAFGETILGPSGEIDRSRLAEAAFADPSHRDTLNAIVHPAVSEAVATLILDHRHRGTGILLIEGALLASSAHVDRTRYDRILWLDAPDSVREKRLRAAGREAHVHRGDDVLPTGDVTIVDATGTIEDVAARVAETIDSIAD
jgi:dephospho-CoA kinase